VGGCGQATWAIKESSTCSSSRPFSSYLIYRTSVTASTSTISDPSALFWIIERNENSSFRKVACVLVKRTAAPLEPLNNATIGKEMRCRRHVWSCYLATSFLLSICWVPFQSMASPCPTKAILEAEVELHCSVSDAGDGP
jgi:hypothetical protein